MLPNAPTAASGVRNVGIAASLRMPRDAPTEASPIMQVSRGLPIERLVSTSARATDSAAPVTFGE